MRRRLCARSAWWHYLIRGAEFRKSFRPPARPTFRRGQRDSRLHGLSKEMTPLGVCPRPIPTRRGVPGNRGVSELEGKAEPTCQPHTAGGGPGKVGRVPSEAPLRKVAASGSDGDAGPGTRGLVLPPRRTPQPRGRERTHPDRASVMRNEVTPSGPGRASRDAARRIDARAGTRSPQKRTLPAARRRATGQIGLVPNPKGC
jgi:hypothetical protein